MDELLDRYRQERSDREKAHTAKLDEMRQRHAAYRDELRQKGAARRQHARTYGSTLGGRAHDRDERRERMSQSVEQAARERDAVRSRTRAPTRHGFLQAEAEAGNEKALALLARWSAGGVRSRRTCCTPRICRPATR